MPNNQVSLFCLFLKKKQSSGFVPHRPSVCLLMGLKPSHIIQELLAFVCCELCDIKPGFPFPCVCVSVLCLSQKKKKKRDEVCLFILFYFLVWYHNFPFKIF